MDLQFIFNVIAVTAITSLSVTCWLLKRDKDQLTIELNKRRLQKSVLAPAPPRAAVTPQPAAPAKPQDIREFVAGRAQNWPAPSAAGLTRLGN